MNFALMFALALGIDYALFIVYRFRGAFFGSKLSAQEATAATMDTAGKAVLFSGVTVLISLSAVMLVPSPAFRSTSLGIMLAVVFVLAATLTLLPAVLAKLGPRVDKFALPWAHSGEHHSPRFAAWGERLWRQPLRLRPGGARAARGARAAGALAEDRDALDQGRSVGRQLSAGLRRSPEGVRAGFDGSAPDRCSEGAGCAGCSGGAARSGHCARDAAAAGRRRHGARAGDPDDRPFGNGNRHDDRPSARSCRRRRSSVVRWRRTTTSRRRCPPRRRW